MSKHVINKYIWLVDTIQRYGRITRDKLNELWVNSSLSDGEPMSRRTFYNYRQGISEMFNINIVGDNSTFEYYIADDNRKQSSKMINLLLDSASMNDLLRDSHGITDRIILEDIPSARVNLPTIMQALKSCNRITFSYRSYNRVNPSLDVEIKPYCIRLFKQLWYVIGYNLKDRKIKTYSLDRMSDVIICEETFEMPADFDGNTYFKDCFGVMTSKGRARKVVLKVSSNKAKYLRALPLHHSQREEIHDKYSIFYYKLLLTNDLAAEILSHGADIQVLSPVELRALVITKLQNALSQY